MFQTLGDEAMHVAVIQGIKHVLALLTRLHQLGRTQQPKLMRNGRRADVQNRRDVAHAELTQSQRMQNANPGAVAQQAENLRQARRGSVGQEEVTHLPYPVVVDAGLFTGIKPTLFI